MKAKDIRYRLTNTKPRASAILTGIAGVHYVVSALSDRGLIALPTVRNVAGYDIIVASPDGKHHANIQVKTSANPKARFWLMPSSGKIRCGRHDWYVLLRKGTDGCPYEGLMLTGAEARKEVARREKYLARLNQKTGRKNIGSSIYPGPKRTAWNRRWERWRLSGS